MAFKAGLNNQRRGLVVSVPVAAAAAGALGATLFLGGPATRPVTAQDPVALTQEQRSTATALEGAFERISDTVGPATVRIEAVLDDGSSSNDQQPRRRTTPVPPGGGGGDDEEGPFGGFPFPFQFPQPGRPRGGGQASGSGVIVRQDGYILTNDHVVAGAKDNSVTVTLSDGRELKGKVFRDPRSDLAIVKVDAGKPLPYARLADSGRVRVGQWAVAIGSPFGQRNTMTAGIVSALHRTGQAGRADEQRSYNNLIQTDASINPGNSGGPLLNINGEVMGINVLIYSPSGGNVGIGFAIPANTARNVMDQLISTGKVTRGALGVSIGDASALPPELRSQFGADKGAFVREVPEDSPAGRAGIQAGDIITRFNDREITDAGSLQDATGAARPGAQVTITLLRNKQQKTVPVTLVSLDQIQSADAAGAANGPARRTPGAAPRRGTTELGFEAQTLTAQTGRELNAPAGTRGVVVGDVQTGSPAFLAGLTPGNVITAVNNSPVASVEALNRALAAAKSGDVILMSVLRIRDDNKRVRSIVLVTIP